MSRAVRICRRACFATLLFAAAAWPVSAGPLQLDPPTIDRLAALKVLRGPSVDTDSLRDRPVVVAFFASWCVPCRAGFVELRKLIDNVGPANVTVVAINWLEDAGHYPGETFRLQRLLDRVAPHITVVAGDKATSAAFDGVTALPTLFVFGRDGAENFRFKYDGVSPPSHPSHEELLQALGGSSVAPLVLAPDPMQISGPSEPTPNSSPQRAPSSMKIAIPKERRPYEQRVAATPETVKRYIGLGAEVAIEAGAGTQASYLDAAYEEAGATIAPDAGGAFRDADLVLKVQRPMTAEEGRDELSQIPDGTTLVGLLNPYGSEFEIALRAYVRKRINAFALELTPRISRAQSMDVLSSQSNLAGYRAVIDAVYEFGRAMPMMMTAAGRINPAKVFVMGAGVAGLQAIATARRLGAIVSATDVRPVAKEQMESLGASFVMVERAKRRRPPRPPAATPVRCPRTISGARPN